MHTLVWVTYKMKTFISLYQIKKTASHFKTHMGKINIHSLFEKNFKRYRHRIKETKKIYSVKGNKYSKKRHVLHLNIVNEFMKKASSPGKGERSIAVLIGGGTASGKTTVRKKIVENMLNEKNIRACIVDPDEIKDYIPEYASLKKKHPDDAARLVHKESVDISDLLVKRLIRYRKHFVYEGTMARTKKYEKLVKTLKKSRYEVYVYIVDIPLELAKHRAAERARMTGRMIPAHIIENTHRQVPITFEVIKNLVDRYYVYDNRNGFVLIASKYYVNQPLYDEFLKKVETR